MSDRVPHRCFLTERFSVFYGPELGHVEASIFPTRHLRTKTPFQNSSKRLVHGVNQYSSAADPGRKQILQSHASQHVLSINEVFVTSAAAALLVYLVAASTGSPYHPWTSRIKVHVG